MCCCFICCCSLRNLRLGMPTWRRRPLPLLHLPLLLQLFPQKSAFGNAHLETSASSCARCRIGWALRQEFFLAYSSMLPVCARATPSNEVIAAPRSRVSARKTALFSSATSALSSWSTISLLSAMEDSVSSCAVSSRPKGSICPKGICVSMSKALFDAGASLGSSSGSLAAAGLAGMAGEGPATFFASSASAPPSTSLATSNKCKGPLASFDSGSAACFWVACKVAGDASKTTVSR
mmetsp:Transcript_25373/g.48569  ORF Transcript_25373/g.48569 Transcript_25373/m.48569 type:complete len:236 (-) Transcript_25373:96-803(-)